jgi:hypothetical protein
VPLSPSHDDAPNSSHLRTMGCSSKSSHHYKSPGQPHTHALCSPLSHSSYQCPTMGSSSTSYPYRRFLCGSCILPGRLQMAPRVLRSLDSSWSSPSLDANSRWTSPNRFLCGSSTVESRTSLPPLGSKIPPMVYSNIRQSYTTSRMFRVSKSAAVGQELATQIGSSAPASTYSGNSTSHLDTEPACCRNHRCHQS